MAVQELFPGTQVTIGPVIENGFYYDIDYDRQLNPDDLEALEKRIQELIKTDYPVIKRWASRDEALAEFKERDEPYKLEIIDRDIPDDGSKIGLYHHQEYMDMCRGPHVPNTRFLRHFKLTNVTGAYWRGDPKNKQLQRIYGKDVIVLAPRPGPCARGQTTPGPRWSSFSPALLFVEPAGVDIA